MPYDEGRYVYRDPRRRELFTKVRLRHDPCECGRGKSFFYYLAPTMDDGPVGLGQSMWRKPPDADWYFYRLDGCILALLAGGTRPSIGLKARRTGLSESASMDLATSHHQGAGNATLQQASWLERAST